MTEDDGDGDRLIRITGVLLVVAVLAGFGVLVLAGANAPSGQPEAPDAEFSITRVNDSYVRVTHVRGEPIAVGDVVVSVDGKIRQLTWTGTGTTVSEGNSALLRARSKRVVRVWWEGPPGSRVLLVRRTVP